MSGELPVSSIRHELLKGCPTDMDQIGVVAALEVHIRLSRQAVVNNNIEPICGTDHRHCPRLAIEKQRLDLLLTGHIYLPAKQSPELFKLNMAGGWKHCQHEATAAFEDDCLRQPIGWHRLAAALAEAVSVRGCGTKSYAIPRSTRYYARATAIPIVRVLFGSGMTLGRAQSGLRQRATCGPVTIVFYEHLIGTITTRKDV